MEKVLIIAYFFPPCNLTASQRAFSWAKYLQRSGYRPVILTRRWDHKINVLADVSHSTPGEAVYESHPGYEVHYLPYHGNLRDKIYATYEERKFSGIRKSLSLLELLLQHFFTFAIPYKNMFHFAEDLLRADPAIRKVIITGNPFNTFKMGYNLHSEFHANWIADYRDAWSTSEINLAHRSFLFRLINLLDRYFEKKWVASASYVTASSEPIAASITSLTGTKSIALHNGFISEDFEGITAEKYDLFTITFVGTLYPGQKVEIFCEAFKRLVDSDPAMRIKFYCPGLAFYKDQLERLTKLMIGYEKYFEAAPRMERKKILEIERRSHVLLHVAWDEQKGIIASKIYEYIASGTYILVTPSDHGSIHEIVEKSGCGICTDSVDETFSFLKSEYDNFLLGNFRANDTSGERVLQFSRENQTKRLAELLNKI